MEIKISVFETPKVKVHSQWPLTLTLLGSNSETIEGMDLKLMMLYYLYRHI